MLTPRVHLQFSVIDHLGFDPTPAGAQIHCSVLALQATLDISDTRCQVPHYIRAATMHSSPVPSRPLYQISLDSQMQFVHGGIQCISHRKRLNTRNNLVSGTSGQQVVAVACRVYILYAAASGQVIAWGSSPGMVSLGGVLEGWSGRRKPGNL
jgi:hypothetical protein